MKFICIGGMCLGAMCLKFLNDKKYSELKSPINNVQLNGGFLNSHKLFDGTFEKEILENSHINVKHIFIEGDKFPNQWWSESYKFPHTDFLKDNTIPKFKRRYDDLIEFIKNPTEDYRFIYSLYKDDVNLSEDEIRLQLDKLSEYIDVSKIIFLGSERYNGNKPTLCGYKVAKNKFKNRNENFKNVVGNRYFIIAPSNVYELASKDFIAQFEDMIKSEGCSPTPL